MTEESTEVASTSETESSRDPLRWRRPFGIGVVLALVAVVAIHYGWRSGSGPEQVVGAGSSAELPAFVDDVEAHVRSEEHTSELQSLMRISYAVFCLKKNKNKSTVYIRK